VGQPAPAFSGTDSSGTLRNLADFKGRIVVLEWSNHECPFVERHYGNGTMQSLQKEAATQNAVWLTVLSSAPGQQGAVSPAKADELTSARGGRPTAVILDPSGEIGRLYGARTTPHMFVIDASGTLVYAGAIDDQPSNASANPATARNYVRETVSAVRDGKPAPTASTQPYGCSVKYGS
jgi:peroxiredoxin